MKGSPRGGACLAGRLERLLLQEASCHTALSGAPDAPVHTGQQGTLTQTPCHSSTGSTTALASSVKHHRYQGHEVWGLQASWLPTTHASQGCSHMQTKAPAHSQLMLSPTELCEQYNLSLLRLKESLRLRGGSRLLVEKPKLTDLGFMRISAQELLGQGLLPSEP